MRSGQCARPIVFIFTAFTLYSLAQRYTGASTFVFSLMAAYAPGKGTRAARTIASPPAYSSG